MKCKHLLESVLLIVLLVKITLTALLETALHNGQNAMLFNIRDVPASETIRKAELHLFKKGEDKAGKQIKARIDAHWRKTSSSRIRRSLVKEKYLNMTSSEWEKFDVTWVVKEWLEMPLKESKFVLTMNGQKPTEDGAIIVNKKSPKLSVREWEQQRPFLVIESREAGMKRERRAVRNVMGSRGNRRGGRAGGRFGNKNRARKLHEKAKVEMCRRRSFYLDFQRINWSKQIVSPMGFDMYFCQGTCPKPLGPHMNTTNHAVIQNQVNSFDPTLVPPPCCVPTTLGDQSFLYINPNNQIVMKTYEDIVVVGCGCR